MKRYLMKLFLSAFVLLAGASSLSAQTEKFYFGVTGYIGDNPSATIDATVYDNYSFVVGLPASGVDKVGVQKAKITMRMTDVASLGVKGQRSYEKIRHLYTI